MSSVALWQQYWAKPDDDLLRVYADALEEDGDPRGRYIQLCLAGKRDEASVWQRKHGGNLVGVAKKALSAWHFADNGTVATARTELPKLVAGIDVVRNIAPRLVLGVTSIRTQKDAGAFGKMSPSWVGRIYMLDIECAVTDAQLALMAPALTELRHLGLTCRGRPSTCFSPSGLRSFGTRMGKLRLLWLDHSQYGGRPIAEYARAIAESFPALEALEFPGITTADLRKRPLKLNEIVNRSEVATKIESVLTHAPT